MELASLPLDSLQQHPTPQMEEAPQVSDCTAYESLPCDKASDRSGALLVPKQERIFNPIYGAGGGATSTSFKGNAPKKPPLTFRSNGSAKRSSWTIACVAASVILCLTLLFSIAAIVLTLKLNFTAPKTNAPVVSVEVVDYNNCTVFLQQKTLEAGHTVETIIHTTNVPVSATVRFLTLLLSPSLFISHLLLSPSLFLSHLLLSPSLFLSHVLLSPSLFLSHVLLSPSLFLSHVLLSLSLPYF